MFSAFLDELQKSPLPTIVVFEDVHWADEATLDLIKFLGRRIPHLPVLFLVTYRDTELSLDHPLRSVIGDLPGNAVARLRLTPLSEHAITGNTYAHDAERPYDTKVAWWNPLIGPGRFFDTSRSFVICSNILGGCYGSTGPSSPDPRTGKPYGMRFPVITIRDMVDAQRKLVEHLGVRHISMVAGGSIGGQQALEWAVSYPELVEKVIVVAATAALTSQAVAFSEVQRQAILSDPRWQQGNYQPGEGPNAGLAIARMLAMITYQSEESMELRFGRREERQVDSASPAGYSDLGKRFDVEGYLYHQQHI